MLSALYAIFGQLFPTLIHSAFQYVKTSRSKGTKNEKTPIILS